MKSVPPRGSGWVCQLPIVNCRFQIGVWRKSQLAIGNRRSDDPPATARWYWPHRLGPLSSGKMCHPFCNARRSL